MNHIEALKEICDVDCVLTDQASLNTYGKDWTKIHQPDPFAIVIPKTTEQVQAIVKFANQESLSLSAIGW